MNPDTVPLHQDQHILSNEGYALMAAAFEVHREIGGGLLEDSYQECLQRELTLRRIPFIAKQELSIYYKGHEINKRYIPDLFVYGEIVVELKSVSNLLPEHEAQLLNYMRLTRKPVGYLINLGPISKAQWKRFVLSEFAQQMKANH